jgi:pyruvate formate lyase activating enzyme
VTGVGNVSILQNLERLAATHPDVRVRFPLIPGINEDEENVAAMGELLASLRLPRVDVLPYHKAGAAKYDRMRIPYALRDTEPPPPSTIDRVVSTLSRFGLQVQVGG